MKLCRSEKIRKHGYDLRVELCPGKSLESLERSRESYSFSIATICRHCVERIGDGHNPGSQRDALLLLVLPDIRFHSTSRDGGVSLNSRSDIREYS